MSFRSFFATLLLLAAANAFVPSQQRPAFAPTTSSSSLSFGFLKELGLEKPSWLPDFGSKKDDTPAAEAVNDEEESSEEESEAVEE